MKTKTFTILLFLGLNKLLNAQNDTLQSSIGYTKTFQGNGPSFSVDIYSSYPKDLNTSSLFFIEITEKDTYGNTGFMGPNFNRINSKVISKMNSKYPFKFDSFSNEYKLKGADFFIKQGYKYRLLIQSTWYEIYSNLSESYVWKQNFAIAIQDLETNLIYGCKDWYWPGNFVNKFIKSVK